MLVVYSALILGVLGFVSGTFLAFAAAKFAVKENPKEKLIEVVLPGVNCGACGYPGCSGFAKAVSEGKASADGCIPGRRAGVPEKIKKLLEAPDDAIEKMWEKAGGDPEAAVKEFFAGTAPAEDAKPKKPSRPTKEETEKYKAMLEEKPVAKAVYSILPKIDCGLCGHPGCAAFAIKIVEEKENPAKCIPGKRQNVEEKVKNIKEKSPEEIKKIVEETKGDIEELKKRFEV